MMNVSAWSIRNPVIPLVIFTALTANLELLAQCERGLRAVQAAERTTSGEILDLEADLRIGADIGLTRARFGSVDFLVNLACSYVDDGLRSGRADWHKALDVNVVSAVMMLKAVHPHMQKAGAGAVVLAAGACTFSSTLSLLAGRKLPK